MVRKGFVTDIFLKVGVIVIKLLKVNLYSVQG
jgi:hypothetical protein